MGHFKLKILYAFSILLILSGDVFGQDQKSVQRVKAIDPFLKPAQVHIQQNSAEDLWITSPLKVMRYNSAEVITYNKFRGIPSEIGKEFIATYSDSKDQIWLSGVNGLAVFSAKKDEFRFVSSITGKIYTFIEDQNKQLWIAAENGIFKLNIDSDKTDFGISRFLSENTMASAATIFNDKIVFAGSNGILTIDRISGKFNKVDTGYFRDLKITSAVSLTDFVLLGTDGKGFYKIDSNFNNLQKVYSLPYELTSASVTGMSSLGNEILVSTDGNGLYRIDDDLSSSEKLSEAPAQIYTSFLNRQNLLWMVSKQGLYLQNLSDLAVDHLYHDPAKYSSLADNFVTASATDSRGYVWFGTSKGLSIWNPGNNRWSHIKNLNYTRSLSKPDVITDIKATGQHVWVATENDGVYKININTLLRAHYSTDAKFKTEIKSANTVFIDAQQNVWIGGETGYLTMISENNQISSFPIKDVQAIAELGPKQLIVATKNRLQSLNPSTGRITDLEKLNASETLNYYAVNDLKITQSGLGLIATEGAGLITYDFESEELNELNESKGLPSNNVEGIAEEGNNGIWLSTDKGLAYYNTVTKDLKLFSELNGLSTNEFTAGFSKLANGSLVLGSAKGVNIFRPKTMLAQQEVTPKIQWNDLLLPGEKDEKIKKTDLANLNAIDVDENTGFQIGFTGISHLNPESIQYSWKMEGYDSDWTKTTNLNTASYANLAPGNYIFKVRSKLPDSAWSKPMEIPVKVAAVSGGLSTVYLFMGIGILASVIIFVFVFNKRSRNAEKQAREELRAQLQQEFQKPVESAVKSLSKISSESAEGSTEDLQRFAARFDELFNQILNFNYEESVYEISRIDLNSHFPKLVREIEPVYKLKDLSMVINDQWSDGEFFYNMEMLDKIFFSLVSGSAGYSFKNGKIIVNLIRTNVGDLKLQITDNGRGIPLHDLKVLEKKKQLDNRKRFRDKSGLRYILKAKDLIQKSGGNFSYETEKNEGSTFTAVLKNRQQDYRKVPERAAAILKAEKKSPVVQTELSSEISNLSESKILIIDGDQANRERLVTTIGKYCQIYQVASAEEGMEKAEMIFPDIIICTTTLPDLSVFQFSKMLKRDTGLNHTSLMLIAEEDQVIAEDQLVGFDEVIRKPLDLNLILSKLSKIIKWQEDSRKAFKQAHLENQPVSYRNEADRKFIEKLNELIIEQINNESFSVHELSAAMNVTSNSLFLKLKNLVGLSPQDYMEFTRLNYARELTQTSNFNTMEVAYRSGFSSPSLFYSSFKKFYGFEMTDSIDKL